MAWTTPKTDWATGDLVAANELNEVGEDLQYLKSALDGYILIRDEKASGTTGGTFTSGAWQTRDLNTEVVDTGNHASVATNQITLAAGTYRFRIVAPAHLVLHQRN